jgi:hypothetical protein
MSSQHDVIPTPPGIENLSPEKKKKLSLCLSSAACYTSPHKDNASAFTLRAATTGATGGSWPSAGDPATYKGFVELLHEVGGPLLFMETTVRFYVWSPIPVISSVLAMGQRNIALATCLLSLHGDAKIARRLKDMPDYSGMSPKEISIYADYKHDYAVISAWNFAWRERLWDLIEAFVCLGLEINTKMPGWVQSFVPSHKKLRGLFHYAFDYRREVLASALVR